MQFQRRWTEEEEKTALELLASGARPEAFTLKLGRSRNNVTAHFYYKNHKEVINEKDRLQRNSSNGAKGPVHAAVQPSDSMVVDAIYRLTAPRTVTAWVCGDPAPGYSALDAQKLGQ